MQTISRRSEGVNLYSKVLPVRLQLRSPFHECEADATILSVWSATLPRPRSHKGFPGNAVSVLSKQGSHRRRARDPLGDGLAKEVRAAGVQELASAPLEKAIRQATGVLLEFHRKHPAFRTLLAEAPLSKDALEQKHLLAQTFIDQLSEFGNMAAHSVSESGCQMRVSGTISAAH
jgi:Tetracyclin repressor-like, C-terminal domain